MPLTLIKTPFNDESFIFENKWDGFRCLAFIEEDRVSLKSKNQRDITRKYPELMYLNDSLKGKEGILDGEICILDKRGHPLFSRMQHSFLLKDPVSIKRRSQEEMVTYIVWDLLYFDGEDLRQKPLLYRRQLLKEVVLKGPCLMISSTIDGQGRALFQAVKKEGLEGIVAKDKKSPYLSIPNSYWLKIKAFQYIQTFIGGYDLKRRLFSVGVFLGKKLQYLGTISSSLKDEELSILFRRLKIIHINDSPFSPPLKKESIQWVKPLVPAQVKFLEITSKLKFRHGLIISIGGDLNAYPSGRG